MAGDLHTKIVSSAFKETRSLGSDESVYEKRLKPFVMVRKMF